MPVIKSLENQIRIKKGKWKIRYKQIIKTRKWLKISYSKSRKIYHIIKIVQIEINKNWNY